MRLFMFGGVMALCTTLSAAETQSITTRSGVIYTNAIIQRADPDGVVVAYDPQPGSLGIAKLKFPNLPDEIQKQYNYRATEAVIFEQNQAAGIVRRQEEIARGEIEQQRRHDDLRQQKAKVEAREAKRQEMAAMFASMPVGGYGGGYYGDGGGDWYGMGHRRFRFNSPGPLNPYGADKFDGRSFDGRVDTKNFSNGLGLSGLGTGWGNSGHWGPLPGPASRGPVHKGASPGPATQNKSLH